eukprot:4731581-Amphidinium_carterae.1
MQEVCICSRVHSPLFDCCLRELIVPQDGVPGLQTAEGFFIGERGFEKSQNAQGLRYRMRPTPQDWNGQFGLLLLSYLSPTPSGQTTLHSSANLGPIDRQEHQERFPRVQKHSSVAACKCSLQLEDFSCVLCTPTLGRTSLHFVLGTWRWF